MRTHDTTLAYEAMPARRCLRVAAQTHARARAGVVSRACRSETGLIDRFVEHGRTFAGNLINAGVYIFSPSIFERIALRPTSMEKEVLPALAAEEQLYCKTLDGWWMNIKKPPSFLQGTSHYLAYLSKNRPAELMPLNGVCAGNVVMDPSASVSTGCKLGPDVVIGPGCVVEDGVRLARCILLEGARVCSHAVVLDSIVGWRAAVGSWARVEGVSVLGEDVHVSPELCINGALILPHKSIGDNVTCAAPAPHVAHAITRPVQVRRVDTRVHAACWPACCGHGALG